MANLGQVDWDLLTSALYEEAIRRCEASLSHLGPLVMRSGQHTGRLPHNKLRVRQPSSENKISWGKINRPLDRAKFDGLKYRLCAYLQGKDVFIQNCCAGVDENYRLPIRIIRERATAALFARTMFIRKLDLKNALARGATKFLSRPLDPKSLLDEVEACLRRPGFPLSNVLRPDVSDDLFYGSSWMERPAPRESWR